MVKDLPANAGDVKMWVGSLGQEGHGSPLQCSCLENPMDRGVWRATVHRAAEPDTAEATWHTTTFVVFMVHQLSS